LPGAGKLIAKADRVEVQYIPLPMSKEEECKVQNGKSQVVNFDFYTLQFAF
jgi:hypothetical protein